YIKMIDPPARPHDATRLLDKPSTTDRNVVAGVAGHGEAPRIQRLANETVVGICQLILKEVPAQLAIEEEAAFSEGGVDAHKRHLSVLAQGPRRSVKDTVEEDGGDVRTVEPSRKVWVSEGPGRRDVFCFGFKVAGGHAPVPIR